LPPDEFFARINAKWSRLEEKDPLELEETHQKRVAHLKLPKSAICITDYESIEQLAIDLAIMPGAGISNVEVIPLAEAIKPRIKLSSNR
jgi:hypothetical protein